MLAPGVMISACGLLLLGMNNKYSLVVNRIRILNEEKRRFINKAADKEFSYEENIRLESISTQISDLTYRVKLVRNAVFFYTAAVALFVLTSLFIGVQYLGDFQNLNFVVTTLFLFGMVAVLAGVTFAAYETVKGYQIIRYEVKSEE
ncbi:MAG: DUF2721 domain-containing protein [Ignavibacteriales bacterium]|nr:MAG: DUF2721 domain-containing protein [Ignavibacteriales bacterium]